MNYGQILKKISNESDKLTASVDEFGVRASVSATILSGKLAETAGLTNKLTNEFQGTSKAAADVRLNTTTGSLTLLASASFTRNLIDPNPYYIGNDIGAANNFNGHVDEFRVILGECKYTSNFTVETSAYSMHSTQGQYYRPIDRRSHCHPARNMGSCVTILRIPRGSVLGLTRQS